MTGGGGGTIGPADRLRYRSSAQTLYANTCSAPLIVETRNATQVMPVLSPTQINFSVMTGGGLITFYSDASCTTASSIATIATGASTATVYFRSNTVGMWNITATSPPLTAIGQTQNVLAPPSGLIFVNAAPAPPTAAGTCFVATLEARALAGAAVLIADAPISLQSGLAAGLRFFTGTTCAGASIGTVTIPNGGSRVSFSVMTVSGGANTITATATFATATLQFPVIGLVRRGTCSIATTGSLTLCPITPVHASASRTALFYQASSPTASDADDSEVRCRLLQSDLIVCERTGTGLNSTATINWQTVELVSGLTVQRASASTCPVGAFTVPLDAGVNPANSFVLSSFSGVGTNFDGDDLNSARLQPDGGILLENRSGQACTGYEFQVVQLNGISALRGSGPSMMFGVNEVTVGPLPAASTNTVVFNQALAAGAFPDNVGMCNLMVRSEIASPTTLRFARGAGSTQLLCSTVTITEQQWERVDFGSRARVQTFVVPLSNNNLDLAINPVDSTRSVVFAGGQMAGGQASGETSMNNNSSDAIAAGMAQLELTADNNVRVTRGRNQANATITVYVVEFEP